jgi:hypothetical protein
MRVFLQDGGIFVVPSIIAMLFGLFLFFVARDLTIPGITRQNLSHRLNDRWLASPWLWLVGFIGKAGE